MPAREAPCVELGSAPDTASIGGSPTPSEISSASSPEPHNIRATPLFRALAMLPPEPEQPAGQDELERRLPGYRRIIIPRELTLIELLKQSSGVTNDEEVLRIREATLRVVAERVGLRRLHVLAPRLRSLTLDGSALSSLRELGIGLVHLRILSINRCGLTSLDGVWGLGALRELHAANNRLQDLQPLAALQKLHTLNLADNPIAESSRLWTLGVCGALRRLTLRGTPASDLPDYHAQVISALPMLIYLDDRLLHADIDDEETEEVIEDPCSSSDSEVEELPLIDLMKVPPAEADSGPLTEIIKCIPDEDGDHDGNSVNDVQAESTGMLSLRRRPATTEGAGLRPLPPNMRPRPRTAHDHPNVNTPTRLQILNTLMDEEWRSSGSILTSQGAVCGNLAQALRRTRPTTAQRRTPEWMEEEAEKELVQQSMEEASRALAAEIPRAPRLEDWEQFRQLTGIDIDIDFNERPRGDATSAIERLERIERETTERLKLESDSDSASATMTTPSRFGSAMIMSDYDLWRQTEFAPTSGFQGNVDALFRDIGIVRCIDDSLPD